MKPSDRLLNWNLQQANGKPLALRLILTGRCPVHTQLLDRTAQWTEEFRGIGAGLGNVWLEKVKFQTSRAVSLEDVDGADTALTGLLQSIQALQLDGDTISALVPELAIYEASYRLKSTANEESFLDLHRLRQPQNFARTVQDLLIAKTSPTRQNSMRLKRLDLKAVGPFTDRTLEFNSIKPGLHIIYGPNEAGKSSSLRALKALLYGFDQRTPDNFLHNYEQLLVGGCLENSDGEELDFWRRKKRIGDVVDQEGNPLPANALARFLHGVEPEIFESLYGIDHDTLVRGGEEILAQKGEVGQALFAAGAGISSLREVIDQLDKEASELFKSTGQLPEINKAIKKFKELQKEEKAASLSCKDWKEHRNALKIAEEQRTKLEKERDYKNKELRRLERLAQAIPELGSLTSYSEQLRALGDVILLPPDFTENHRQVDQAIREVTLQLQKDAEHLEKLEVKRRILSFNKDLLREAERVDDFHQRLGEYRKGLKDRPEREGMRISLRREAAQLL